MPFTTASADGVAIYYETHGEIDDPPLLLIAGLGNQLLFWEDEFIQGLIDRAFRVIVFDNRDTGLSTTFEQHPVNLLELVTALGAGEDVVAPYGLDDLAEDAVAVLDAAELDRAHVLGVSLGGMAAQAMAVAHPGRVQSLTLLSSTTGNPNYGQATAECLEALLAPVPDDPETALEHDVNVRKLWSTRAHFDPDWTRNYFQQASERSTVPGGTSRQMLAVLTAGDREPALRELTTPTLVLHGTDDPLIDRSGGERLVDVIPGAQYVVLDDMGHDLPPHYWAPVIESVTQLAIRSR